MAAHSSVGTYRKGRAGGVIVGMANAATWRQFNIWWTTAGGTLKQTITSLGGLDWLWWSLDNSSTAQMRLTSRVFQWNVWAWSQSTSCITYLSSTSPFSPSHPGEGCPDSWWDRRVGWGVSAVETYCETVPDTFIQPNFGPIRGKLQMSF